MPLRDIRVLCNLRRPLAAAVPTLDLAHPGIETPDAKGRTANSFDRAETDTHGRA
jgi:hypothetical protein